MYWEHFGFNEPPFALTPNPAFLFLSAAHQEAFAHLLFAIESRAGFIELSGEVGTGKTTIVRTLLNQLDPEKFRTGLIFNPTLTPLGLLKEVCSEFGVDAAGSEMHELHQALNRFLLEENSAGHTVVLVIDEAQNLSVPVLEQIRLISNLETERSKLIQIVLVGQPELKALLARQELRQLDQRITVRYHLRPMGSADTAEYIRHRIRSAAGGREPLRFSAGGVKRIFNFSKGLPRLINGVCDRALLLAYTREVNEVSPSMAGLAIADLRKEVRSPLLTRPGAIAALSGGVVLGALLAFVFVPTSAEKGLEVAAPAVRQGAPGPEKGGERPEKVFEAKSATPLPAAAAFAGLSSLPEQENLLVAVNAVLNAWGVRVLSEAEGQGGSIKALARQRGLMATHISGKLEELTRLDAPALLQIALPSGGTRLLALTSIGKESVTVVPPVAGRSTLTKGELAAVWGGGATLLWKDFHGLSAPAGSARGDKVKLLQGLLKGVGCYAGPVNGAMGQKTTEAIAEFQRREQLPVDGRAGGETLLLLYRRAGGFFPPGIVHDGVKASSLRRTGILPVMNLGDA